jgi:RimJ/RimL family protein N-acetyltransferase
MTILLETQRLQMREFVPGDAEALYALNSDPEVMRLTGEPVATDLASLRQAIRDYPDYRRHGYGRWAVLYEARVIGFAGPKYLDELGEVDLGYRFLPDYWGRGLATEAAIAVTGYCFETLGMGRLIGLVLAANGASIRVLEKAGYSFETSVDYEGLNALQYARHAQPEASPPLPGSGAPAKRRQRSPCEPGRAGRTRPRGGPAPADRSRAC